MGCRWGGGPNSGAGLLLAVLLLIAPLSSTLAGQAPGSSGVPVGPTAPEEGTPASEASPEWPPPPVIPPSTESIIPPTLSEQQEAFLGRLLGDVAPPPPATLIRAIVGFVLLLILAYLGGHPRVLALERRLNIVHLVTTGLPFAVLGFVASQPLVGVLTPSLLTEIRPLLPFGLGWIGFVVGSEFNTRAAQRLPPGTGTVAFVIALLPGAAIVGVCGLLLYLSGQDFAETLFLRDALLLGTAGSIGARSGAHFAQARLLGDRPLTRLNGVAALNQVAGVVGLLIVSTYFRPQGPAVAWQLPGSAWLFITVGIGGVMGLFLYLVFTRIHGAQQFLVVLLGAVAFTAGMASYLRLSPVSVCFMAGAIVVNFSRVRTVELRRVLARLERPVYLLFLVIAGALWRPLEWQGWALMILFVSVRLAARHLSVTLLRRFWVHDLAADEQRALATFPIGALSIAIVVSAQDLYSGPTVSWIVTAVIGGALVMELALQLYALNRGRGPRLTEKLAGSG